MFCERCTFLTRHLSYNPEAMPNVELLSGSCIWPDEVSRDWCTQCIWKTREWFHVRYQLTVGEPIPAKALKRWEQLEREYPNWPLFRPERRSPAIAEEVRREVQSDSRLACDELDRLIRE
jgi:hypothetical protein